MTQAFNLSQFANKVNTSGQASLTTAVTGTLPVANGGTGAATLTANNVLLGNGTSAVQAVAPGSNGNVLTSNGSTWTSAAAPSSAPSTAQVQSAMAGSSAGNLGTIATAGCATNVTVTWNTNYAGSGLTSAGYNDFYGFSTVNGSVLSGTWKAVGNARTNGSSATYTTYLRVA
jgi:hypothetical protein